MGIVTRTFLLLFITFLGLTNTLIGQTNPSSSYSWNGEYVRDLEVEKGRTIYNITKTYSISDTELFRLNPELKESGLKAGMKIRIPGVAPEIKDAPTVTPAPKEEPSQNSPRLTGAIKHTVKKKESLFGIAKQYGMSVEDLMAVNPQLKDGLKVGMELVVYPASASQPPPPQKKDTIILEQEVKHVKHCNPLTAQEQRRKLNISLLLPFYLPTDGELNNKSRIGLEFYAGAKIALDSLKRLGFHVQVSMFDTENDSASVEKVFQNQSFLNSDLIIGPLYSAAFIKVARFARDKNIPAISPFSQSEALIEQFPNVVKVIPSSSDLVVSMIETLSKKHPNSKILFITSEDPKDARNNETARTFLTTSGLNYKELAYSEFKTNAEIFDPAKQNIVLFFSLNQVKVIDLSSRLYNSQDSYRIILGGLQEWNKFENIDFKFLSELHFTYSSSVSTDFDSPNSKSFQRKFRDEFKGEPTFYAFQGFDITLYFTKMIAELGKNFSDCLGQQNELCGLNSCYKFRSVGEGKGFSNSYYNVLQMRDFKAVKLEP